MLEAATISMIHPIKRKLRTAVKLLLHNPFALLSALVRIEHFIVFSGQPAEISIHDETLKKKDIICKKITNDELVNLLHSDDYKEQSERFLRLGFNSAYGLYLGNDLIHVSWLIDSTQDFKNTVRNVKLKAGEGEITHCFTSEKFRGHGYYPMAIQSLCGVAATNGIKVIFMIASENNVSSGRGIKKAGLSECSRILRIIFPFAPEWMSLTWRGHRWNFR